MSDPRASLPAPILPPSSVDSDSLRQELARELRMAPGQLDAQASLLQLGLDSMHLMAWLNRLRSRGYHLTLRDLYREPTLAGWSRLLQGGAQPPAILPVTTVWPGMRDGAPFALTPVQHAYLVGRSSRQPLGGVGCHLYQEFDGAGLDAGALERAIRTLTTRHPMLQVAFSADGRQHWCTAPVWQGVTVHDLRTRDEDEGERTLLEQRERLGHRLLAVERGETFDFQLSLLPHGRHRLHVNLDLLVLDAASFTLLFEELAALVAGQPLPPLDADYDFRSYLAQLQHDTAAAREQAQRYWRDKLPSLPAAPSLPLAQEPAQLARVRISRRRAELPHADWQAFRQHAGACGVTPTLALATCFASVLARWSGQSRLLLNLTLFDRQPLHPAVERLMADFTSILLLDVQGEGAAFDTLAQANQNTFADACEHRHWSGVELLRELKKEQRHPHGAPLVFTSNLGRPLYGDNTAAALGEPGWGISQTPQVWIDHLAFEHGSSVWLQWDSNEALFPAGLVDTLFDAYIAQVRHLVNDARAWHEPLPDPMPAAQCEQRARVNATAGPRPSGLLHEGVIERAARAPGAIAVIHRDHPLRYDELVDMARRCAGALAAHGIRAGDRVAISQSRGTGQVVAVLGVLLAGAVYVPVPLEQPAARRRQIHADAGITLVLASRDDDSTPGPGEQDPARRLCWQDAIRHAPIPAPVTVAADSPAYVIYTSGSTGTPKGVVISHRGALNTCAALNRRYRLGPDDRLLALSALHFDLSVYDIFGLLTAGGTLVLVDEGQRRDPSAWCGLIERHRISVWNSVPALFDMLLTYSEGFARQAPARLRLVMLSGDWIGLDLPARYRAFHADGQLVAMGGATEASIWSNAHEVGEVQPHWRSIPYGFPLPNQRYRVVDGSGRDCPDWVAGELWIGGDGVALGYFNDRERTAQQFVGKGDDRWYRTGDLGCYWPDGTLEFLGRRDRQVKIGGHRIELGEIDAVLNRLDGVRAGIALTLGEREKSLAAFVVGAGPSLCSRREADPALPGDYGSLFTPLADDPANPGEDAIRRLVADFLHDHLQRHGVDFRTPLDPGLVAMHYGASAAWYGLFSRWLELLCADGRLVRDGHACRRGPRHDAAGWQPPADSPLQAMADALGDHHATLADILHGRQPAHTLLDHPFWAPERRLLDSAGTRRAIVAFAGVLAGLAQTLRRPLRLIEIGARSALGGHLLLQRLDAGQLSYIALDDSRDRVRGASAGLAAYPHASARHASAAELAALAHTADVVWANNALHRLGADGLTQLAGLAAPGALLLVLERHAPSALALVSADLLATDGLPAAASLMDAAAWQAHFHARGLHGERADRVDELQRFVLRAPAALSRPDPRKLSAALAAQLPAYMLPQRLYFLDAFPLTANGKIDHQALIARCTPPAACPAGQDAPGSATELTLAAIWQTLLAVPDLQRHSDFFQLGGDSLLATRLIGELERAGYEATLGDLFAAPTLAAFAATLQHRPPPAATALRPDPASRHLPFALTDVQQAYLVGRQPGFALGGVGSQFFVEFDAGKLDVGRFETAWNRLIQRHDMLRAVVRDDQLQVLATVPPFVLPRHRFARLDDADDLYRRLSRQVLDPGRWPVFDLQAAEDAHGHFRLYLCLDNLLLDGLSMQILLAELEQCYLQPACTLPPLEIGFRDYRVHVAGQQASEASLAYWRERLDRLPPPPQLPLRCDPASVGVPDFVRLSDHLPAADWQALKARASAARLTPSALLLAAYAAVLSAWSAQRALCLNLTLFDRQPVHAQIEHLLGDFTSLLLLAWQPAGNWLDSAQGLQRQLWQDLAHREVSALQLMRELAQRQGRAAVAMPVVFTSALGFDHGRFLAHASWLTPRRGISQTPQVWLDHQVYESEGELRFNWDAVEALFEPAQLRTMFQQYGALLRRLAVDDDAWQLALDTLLPRATPLLPAGPAPVAVVDRPPAAPSVDDAARVAQLCAHFRQVVGQPILPRQNFFDAGATSLKLVQLHVRLQQAGHGQLQVTDLFAHPSPQALAARLGGQPPSTGTEPQRRLPRRQRRQEPPR